MQTAESNNGNRTEPARSGHRRGSRSRSNYRCQAKIRRYQYLLAGISALFLLIYIFTWIHFAGKSSERRFAIIELRKLQTTHEAMAAELERIRSERDELVQGRIPDLSPLRFDEAIAIGDDYIRNVIFTLVKSGNKEIYEYRLVLSNEGLSVIRPDVEIFLFNELGIQIGNAQVERDDASTHTDRSTLEPGEVRSYSDTFNMLTQGEPAYFLVSARRGEKPGGDKMEEHLGEMVSP